MTARLPRPGAGRPHRQPRMPSSRRGLLGGAEHHGVSHLEGIVIFGDYAGDQVLAAALGLPRPGPGEFVSARLVPRAPGPAGPGAAGDRAYARVIRLEGADWLLASAADPAAPAPALPR